MLVVFVVPLVLVRADVFRLSGQQHVRHGLRVLEEREEVGGGEI